MTFNIEECEYRICKGRVETYVARAKEPPQKIVKSVLTFMSRGRINQSDLEKMLNEIRKELVEPFLTSPWNQSERQARFQLIRDALIKSN